MHELNQKVFKERRLVSWLRSNEVTWKTCIRFWQSYLLHGPLLQECVKLWNVCLCFLSLIDISNENSYWVTQKKQTLFNGYYYVVIKWYLACCFMVWCWLLWNLEINSLYEEENVLRSHSIYIWRETRWIWYLCCFR
jgi:hypothetical protein